MTDNLPQPTSSTRRARLALSLEDLLLTEQETGLSDYLCLSLNTFDEHIKISITTVAATPVTYSAFMHGTATVDLRSLIFVAQPVSLGEISLHRSVSDKRKACVKIARLAPFWRALRTKNLQRRR